MHEHDITLSLCVEDGHGQQARVDETHNAEPEEAVQGYQARKDDGYHAHSQSVSQRATELFENLIELPILYNHNPLYSALSSLAFGILSGSFDVSGCGLDLCLSCSHGTCAYP